ncbi:hypothetical protein LCGC14_0372620 [marine sediment metagenome]|uniref:Uncharacterized protein n=1 Tax=marine sediment metagenome TaxID=412755 RepID=A0A0F9VRW6_9ZZZZ
MSKLKVFLTEESLIELEDDYVDKEDELRNLMFGYIKNLAKNAKMILRNKQFVANLKPYEDNTQHTETIKLKKFKLSKYTIKSDADWIPENLDADDCKPYIIKVGPKTMDRLVTYCQVYQARVVLYNKSLTAADLKIESKKAKPAECFEQIIHEALITNVMEKLNKLDDKEFDEEFEEINKPKSEKAKAKAKRKQRSGRK